MQWTELHRQRLYHIINGEWVRRDLQSFESHLKDLGVKWAELNDEVSDAPEGTVAIWEGPGPTGNKLCWVVPDDVALKLLVLRTN
jgi:hypothetical protein